MVATSGGTTEEAAHHRKINYLPPPVLGPRFGPVRPRRKAVGPTEGWPNRLSPQPKAPENEQTNCVKHFQKSVVA